MVVLFYFLILFSGFALDASTQPILNLEATIDGRESLYPGERTTLVYKFYYKGTINLTKEELPLLSAEGMKKIGDKVVFQSQENGINVNVVAQEVEAIKSGHFSYGPSHISGKVTLFDDERNARSEKSEVQATAPVVTITVKEFPKLNQPKFFDGAVGDFTMDVKLLSKDDVRVGDKISIAVKIQGEGALHTVNVPKLCCMPGFAGVFLQSDLLPSQTLLKESKTFQVDLRVLTEEVSEIPPIYFYFFNPKTEKYVQLKSKPIPIFVKPSLIKKDERKKNKIALVQKSEDSALIKKQEELNKELQDSLVKGEDDAQLAKLFSELKEYPLAVYYYLKALQAHPRDNELKEALNDTLSKLKMKKIDETTPFKKLFFFHYYLTETEKYRFAMVCGAFLLLFGILKIKSRLWIYLRLCLLTLLFMMLLSVLYQRYFASIEAVMLEPSLLYQEGKAQSVVVSQDPLLAGTRVKLLEMSEDGHFVKVRNDEGVFGYVLTQKIRLLP